MQGGEVTAARPNSSKSQRTQLLLVDDDPHVSEMLAELLDVEGYGVTSAHDAVSALEALRRHTVSVVLCDLRLRAGMDGYEFAQACRSDRRLSHLRLIAISGYEGDEERRRAAAAGFDCLLPKPVDLERLCARSNRGVPRRGFFSDLTRVGILQKI